MWLSTDLRLQRASCPIPEPANPNRKLVTRSLVLASALAILTAGGPAFSAQAAPIAFTVDFDLVNVTNDGNGVYSASSIGPGPFQAQNGAGPVDFSASDFGQIVANYLSPRYFGSDAGPHGSLLANLTNFEWNGRGFVQVPGVSIGGFTVEVAQPAADSIVAANGGRAFPNFSISSDGKTVTFSGGVMQNE
ncbi:MAG: hypothetical protein JO212_01545, partial [Acetobacteraceae bacterium]|nr:hypothetical protein [Acetobacteraceae bacterium]